MNYVRRTSSTAVPISLVPGPMMFHWHCLLFNLDLVAYVIGRSISTSRLHERWMQNAEPSFHAYHPPTHFQTYGAGEELPQHTLDLNNVEIISEQFLRTKIDVVNTSIVLRTTLKAELGHHLYYSQTYNGIPLANTAAHVSLTKDGRIASFSSSMRNFNTIAPPQPTIDVRDVIHRIADSLGGSADLATQRLEYLALEDGHVALAYVVEVKELSKAIWYEMFVDAHSGGLLSVVNFVSSARYRALPFDKPDLRSAQVLVPDPEDLMASPLGWHDTSLFTTVNTTGNNIQTFKWLDPGYVYTAASSSNVAPGTGQSGEDSELLFDYPANASLAPDFEGPDDTYPNLDAARVNAFYVLNMMHDLAWRYGFTEDAFNFQTRNLRGLGNLTKSDDPVRVSIQATDVGVNNAFFASPADGTPGFCYMLFWDYTSPKRDGALANDILTHEYMHGVTNRMTGGGTSRCLQTTESNGLGEGWSDIMAEWTELTSSGVHDYTFGSYVAGNLTGLRHYPYSLNSQTNPLRYSDIEGMLDPHDVGEAWANILHNILASLIEVYGWLETNAAMREPSREEGNVVFLHLIIDALPLQPCNPTFPQARDAILQADHNRYGGVNNCLLWTVFASRGLGTTARDYLDDFTIPNDC